VTTDSSARQVVVVEPRPASWLTHHAASELAEYIRRMTGSAVIISGTPPESNDRMTVIELSLGSGAERLRSLPGAENAERLRDGFVISSQGPRRLTIAAVAPEGLLYGVYEYLERCCGVGFFWDGEHIPERVDVPVDGTDMAVLPRWPIRNYSLPDGWGLAKYYMHFRTQEHRKLTAEWLAKRKVNLSILGFGPSIALAGESAARVFGLDDTRPDNFTIDGYPGVLDYPATARTKLIKDYLDYCRRLGIRFIYGFCYGHVPHQFRDQHPEYRYVGNLYDGIAAIHPDDPACERWMRRFSSDIIATYGTDHLYHDVPYAENTADDDLDQSFRLKLNASLHLAKLYRELDESAIWSMDTWDITFMRTFHKGPLVWTPERVEQYFKSLPLDMMLIYDTWGDEKPSYKETDYYYGARWALGVLHSFQGDDHPHGDLADIIRRIQDLSADPKASNCQGIYVVAESTGHNIVFFDLLTRLAWNPDCVTLDDHLSGFARRRYGGELMLPALELLVRAVYSGGGRWPIYKKLGCHAGPSFWWPVFEEKEVEDDGYAALPNEIGLLRQVVESALEHRERLRGNPLYVIDVSDWCRTYLNYVFNWAVLDAYRGLKAGDVERLRSSAQAARECLKHIEDILSTRQEFSLSAQIDRCMKVPGTNPYLPWYMKKHAVNVLYATNENYEQMHWFYAPRIEVYLREIEKRAMHAVKSINWSDVEERLGQIEKRWLDGDITVPEKHRFGGTTMEAVEQAACAVNSTSLRIMSQEHQARNHL